ASFSMVKGSGICGLRPGTHCQSGDSAFHKCTWASTIMRLRSPCAAGACAAADFEKVSAAPAPSVLFRKLRRDSICESSHARHACDDVVPLAGGLCAFRAPRATRELFILILLRC